MSRASDGGHTEVDGEKEREECEEEEKEEEEEEEEEWEQVGPKNKSTITRQVFRRNDLLFPYLAPFFPTCTSLVHCR